MRRALLMVMIVALVATGTAALVAVPAGAVVRTAADLAGAGSSCSASGNTPAVVCS